MSTSTGHDHIPQLNRLANAELARRSLRVALIYFFVAIIVSFVTDLHEVAPRVTTGFIAFYLVSGLARLRYSLRFEKDYDDNPRRWFVTFNFLTFITAASIGSVMPLVFFKWGAGWTFIICLLSVTGISAGAASSLSPRMSVYRVFQGLLMLPTVITLVAFADGQARALSLLVLLWVGQVMILGSYFHKEFWASLRAQYQLKLRAEALEKAKREVEEAMRIKGDFLANTSHEIRTPLNGIIGMTDLVLESELSDQQRDHLADVKSSGETLLRIINEILDFSKLEAGRVELESIPFSLQSVVDQTIRPLRYSAQSRGNELVDDLSDKLPSHLLGDPHRVWQILTNLVGNSVKFTENGKITIHADTIGCMDDICTVMIRVIDTGVGISPEAQNTIFQAFNQADGSTTRKFGGTGLGLAITKKLVELMNGEITLASQEGEGSTFSILLRLPVAPAEALPKKKKERKEAQVGLEGLKVLLAEDNTVNAKLATRVLGKSGIEVEWVEDGQQAVDAWQKGGHDLILMDVQMPVMDGFEATQAIRDLEGADDHIPIIALTAHALDGYREKCLENGMDDFLTKPLNPRLLRETLGRWSPQAEPQSV